MSTSRYRVMRDRHARFASRRAYLKERAKSAGAGKLCQVLQAFAYGVSHEDGSPAAHLALPYAGTAQDAAQDWEDFPWLTMIFGSGALALPDGSGVAASLAEGVRLQVERLQPRWSEGPVEAESRAEQFTLALAQDRFGASDGHSNPSIAPAPVSELAARLILLAALLTETYHTIQSMVAPPAARWDSDIAVLAEELDAAANTRAKRAIGDARALITQLVKDMENVPGPAVSEAVVLLLKDIAENLQPSLGSPQIDFQRVRLLTEVAWHFLTLGRPIYAGWTDMLLFLTLSQGTHGSRRSPRPDFTDLNLLPDLVKQLYGTPSKSSWITDSEGHGDTSILDSVERRDSLYLAAADVLWEQAAASGGESFADPLPTAVAFVTSFDIELEMALWATSGSRPYRVVIPVHLLQAAYPRDAELCWLIGEFTPPAERSRTREGLEAEYDAMRTPPQWRLLTHDFDVEELRDTPVVVHLSGCPLFELPADLSAASSAELVADLKGAGLAVDPSPGRDAVQHAVTVDEYLAVRQSEVELLWYGADDRVRVRNRALHSDLINSTSRNPRYWMGLGVPVTDAAVRHRLVAQLTRERLAAANEPTSSAGGSLEEDDELGFGPADTRSLPEISGVAINRRIGDVASSMLYWVGFDVVEADCNDFVQDLRHYAHHVRASGPAKKPVLNSICRLDEQSQP